MANSDPFFMDNSLEPGLHGQPAETPAEETPAEPTVEEKIKLGEKEYTQAELQKLVGLGEIGLEAESKYKTRLDRVWPEYTKRSQELVDLRDKTAKYEAQLKELQEKTTQQPQSQQPSLTQEQRQQIAQMTPEMKQQALKQLQELNNELGYTPDNFRRIAMEVIQGQNLINDITGVIDNFTSDGLPNTTVEDVLAHMQETGIRNPEKAYRDMFETEYLEHQANKLAELKSERKGLPTTPKSTAGAKQPAPVKVTDSNLDQLVAEALRENFS